MWSTHLVASSEIGPGILKVFDAAGEFSGEFAVEHRRKVDVEDDVVVDSQTQNGPDETVLAVEVLSQGCPVEPEALRTLVEGEHT